MTRVKFLAAFLIPSLILFPAPAWAQEAIEVTVTPTVSCGQVSFEVVIPGASIPYSLTWDFGDDEGLTEPDVAGFPHSISHIYPGSGEYSWSLTVASGLDPAASTVSGTVSLGPTVTLTSDIFPPLLTLSDGQAALNFTAQVLGGEAPYAYSWDLDGDGALDPGADPASSSAAFTYTQAGRFQASVAVTDGCGLTAADSLTVVVIDPETSCHPMAQRIAEGVNSLFPNQAEQLYTCEDIFNIFEGGLTGSWVGFGRMWHAYQLAQTLDDLTWEEILDWHLDGNGWGLLVQLNRFSNALGEIGLGELVERVVSGEATVSQIRTAVQMVARFGADFEDALARVGAGASPGEVGQLYRTAEDLDLDPEVLDGYLETGASLAELRHAARLAEQAGADWASVVATHGAGYSWGQIGQAYRLAGAGGDVAEILQTGTQEFRSQQREQEQEQRQAEVTTRTATRLAERYGVSAEEVMRVYNDVCSADWSCVRTHFQELARSGHQTGRPEDRGGGRP